MYVSPIDDHACFMCIGASAITPLAPGDDENPLHNPDPIIFSYLLGADLLIHPIITNPEASGVNHVTMHFPTYDRYSIGRVCKGVYLAK